MIVAELAACVVRAGDTCCTFVLLTMIVVYIVYSSLIDYSIEVRRVSGCFKRSCVDDVEGAVEKSLGNPVRVSIRMGFDWLWLVPFKVFR